MTCPGCSRDVTLVGGLCGHCSSTIASALAEGFEDLDFDADVVDVYEHEDGHYHVRFDIDEDGGRDA